MKKYLSTYYYGYYEKAEYYLHYTISVCKKPIEVYRRICPNRNKIRLD